jgi:hypothetical protein
MSDDDDVQPATYRLALMSATGGRGDQGRVAGVADAAEATLLFDPQTSGGLLACIPADRVTAFEDAPGDWPLGASVIGRVAAAGAHDVVVG